MTDKQNYKDLPPEAGVKPRYTEPNPPPGEVGAHGHYSGQEYDAPGQAEWRRKADRSPPPGELSGSGIGAGGGQDGEDYDSDPQGGSGVLPAAGTGSKGEA